MSEVSHQCSYEAAQFTEGSSVNTKWFLRDFILHQFLRQD